MKENELSAEGQSMIIGKMTPEQIIEGQRLAEEYAKKYLKPSQPSNP